MRLLSFLLAFLFSVCSFASGLSAPFNGSRFTGFTQPSTVVEYDSTMDHNVKLVDLSGSNYATYSEDFNSWTKTNLTVSTNTARDPRFNTLTVDTLVEANDVGQQHSVHQSISLTSGVKYTFSVYPKDENDERFMSTAVHSDWDKWHSHKIMWDLADLTRSRFTTEGVYATLDATMTGAKNIEFTDTLIRPGQDYSGTVSGNCTIRNLRLRSSQ